MVTHSGIITLLTDFGLYDGFIGTMKGVILGINSNARIVDLSHDILPQDIDAAAFILHTSYSYFPIGTVHLAVVDPGVGTARKIIAVEAAGHFFIAPDNGILKYIFSYIPDALVTIINNTRYCLPSISNTFHGRDIFAPIAAHLSLGLYVSKLGPKFSGYITGDIHRPEITRDKIIGTVLHLDRFGNVITNISKDLLEKKYSGCPVSIIIGDSIINNILKSYEEAPDNIPAAVWGSSGYLEIILKGENAAKKLCIERHQRIEII